MSPISITRALAELKRIDEQLEKATRTSLFVVSTVGHGAQRKLLSGNVTLEATAKKLQSSRDSIQHLFTKRQALKAAIVQSNAVTTVTIGGTTMTVAQAIELKRSIQFKRILMESIQAQLVATTKLVDGHNVKLQAEIEANLQAVYGSDKSKLDASSYDAVAVPKLNAREATVFDPTNAVKYVTDLGEEISLVDTELDFTLSESNARTEIQI